MSKKRIYLSTVAGFAALLAASSASAGQVKYRLTNPLGGGEPLLALGTPGSFGALTDVNTVLHFTKFNIAGQTLTNAVFHLYVDLRTVLTVSNNAAALDAGTGVVNTRVSSNLLLPGNVTTTTVTGSGAAAKTYFTYTDFAGTGGSNPSPSASVFFSLPDFNVSLDPGDSVTSTLADGLSTTVGNGGPLVYNKTTSNATDLAAFTGSGTVGLTFLTKTRTLISAEGGNISALQTTNFDVDGEIVYNYTAAVPEPMTAAVLMAGLAGLAGIRRRRR